MKSPFISIVSPMFNEEECIEVLFGRILKVCKKLNSKFEFIAVDDGSSDKTLDILKKLHRKYPQIKIISFARNFGHQVGIIAGLNHAKGDVVVVMDADLQDPPEIIPDMIKKWKEGYKVIYGIRKKRKEMFLKVFCYKLFYRLLLFLTPLKTIPLDAGDFCLMDRKVVEEMCKFKEDRPFVRGLRTWVGFKQTGLEYDRPGRLMGKSKYSISKLVHLAIDGLLSFSSLALHMTIFAGLAISSLSILYAAYITVNRVLIALNLTSDKAIPGWATPVVSITFLMGLQFIFLGILGEYVSRIYAEGKNRPHYVIGEMIGIKDEKRKKSRKK
ncbi:MAG: glycosyltransferase family 2 protein [Actinobacteria bacterium]|nr:glycosyltransferase family 2 protein [Actinomycetota bacterium]